MLMMKYSYGVKPEDKENSCEQNSSAFTSFMESWLLNRLVSQTPSTFNYFICQSLWQENKQTM